MWDVSIGTNLTLTRTIRLRRDRGDSGTDSSSAGAGVPNYISCITIGPDNTEAWYTAKKDETFRGRFLARPAGWPANRSPLVAELTPDHTVRAMIGRVNLNAGFNREPQNESTEGANVNGDNPIRSPRIDIDNSESPTAIVISPRNDYLFVTLQGNDDVAVFDLFKYRANLSRAAVQRLRAGSAPQDLLLNPANNQLWVKNLLSRDVTRYDLQPLFASGARSLAPSTTVTSTLEKLTASVLNGKRLFYRASDAMSLETYISCASCHVDRSHDGRVLDFTQRGEGLRNTTDLRGRAGMGHGNVHWSGNFDEIQDFILDIQNHFGGNGFLPEGQTGHPALGTPNAGRSVELDDLAAYVTSLGRSTLPKSPYRDSSGNLTAQAVAGAAVFASKGCASCHSGAEFTESRAPNPILRDVGTLRTSSGQRLGTSLAGIDTPTLLGVWAGAPYLHDGSARTLEEVFTMAGGTVYQAEFGTFSGNAGEESFLDINQDASARGSAVRLRATGASVTVSNVDGGSGGVGAIELRAMNFSTNVTTTNSTLRLIVNGTSLPTQSVNSVIYNDWRSIRFAGVPLTPGPSNSITVVYESGNVNPFIDELIVSTATDLNKVSASHGVTMSASERDQLLAYVRSLDASASDVSAPALQAVRSRKRHQ